MSCFHFKVCIVLGFLFFSNVSLSQDHQKELDSLEHRLSTMDKTKPDDIILLGTSILSQTSSEEQKSRVLATVAVAYFVKNDLKKSTELFFQAKNAAEKTDNHELIAKMYGSLAHQYVHLKLKDKAEYYLNKAIQEIEQLPEGNNKRYLKGMSHLELGNLEYDNGNYRMANQDYKQSLQHFERMKGNEVQASYHYRRSLYNIGNSYTFLNQPDSAKVYLNKALKIKGDKEGLNYFVKNALARVYVQKGFHQRAIDSLEAILDDKDFEDIGLKSEIYQALSQNYKYLENNELYYVYNEKYIRLRDSLQMNSLKAIDAAINTEQQEYVLALSESDRTNTNLIIGSILFLIGLSGTIIYLVYRRRKERSIFEGIISTLKHKLEAPTETQNEKVVKEEETAIPNSVEQDLLSKLERFESSTRFTNPKLTIATLAVQFKTNTTYLSEVINQYKGKNFNTYINDLRIKYICEKIYKQPEYLNYKISYLAEESGFASHSTFATVFKSVTGISPSTFLREASKHGVSTYKAFK